MHLNQCHNKANEEWQTELTPFQNDDNTDFIVLCIKQKGIFEGKIEQISLSDCELLVIKDDGSSLGSFKPYVHQISISSTCIEFLFQKLKYSSTNVIHIY